MSAEIIHSLSERGIQLQIIDGRLKARGELTDQDRDFIRQHKAEIVELLSKPRPIIRANVEAVYPEILTLPDGRMVRLADVLDQAAPEDFADLMNRKTMYAFASSLQISGRIELFPDWKQSGTAELFPKRKQPPEPDMLSSLADLPLLADDRRFIQQRLFSIPAQQHETVLTEYRRVWLDAAETETDENRRDNQGRRAANLYLLRMPS